MLDITARVEAEAQLRQVTADFTHAVRLSTLGELTTSIAHEIKQPLSAILTNAQTSLRWLAKEPPNLDKAIQLTSRIVESAQRASDIIGRIQDMAGKRPPARGELDLNDLVGECLLFLRHECEDKGVQVVLHLEPGLPRVLGDRVQIQQIVVNLMVNAIQAMAVMALGHRTITIVTITTGSNVVLTVCDSGPGIESAHLAQVFDGFFSTKEAGMGIGLAICQSIITSHGGSISAANDPQGGAMFTVTLPALVTTLD